jgi:uncharacterized membrane protein (DUF2068 family)
MKRPVGITIIAVLALISGLFGLCWPILVLTGSALLGSIFGTVGLIAGLFLIIGPLLQLIFAYGAFNLRPWAWYLGLIATGITVVGVIINLFNGASFWSAIWGSILPIIIFIYLLTSNVRQAFGIIQPPPAPVQAPAPAPPPAQPVSTTPAAPQVSTTSVESSPPTAAAEPQAASEMPPAAETPATAEPPAPDEPPAADDDEQPQS